jgi:hypothetical protein
MREVFLAVLLSVAAAQSIRVERDGILLAHIFPSCDSVATDGAREDRANFSSIRRNELLATIEFEQEWRDYRGQTVPAGTYEMRYAVQPLLKDHAGTSEWRDFAILIGSASSRHPFVMALVPPADGDVKLKVGDLTVGLVLEGVGEIGF